ncbi:MAG TPA: ribokinase [Alphaproteobacteria bacterium]|nr:ribokinase [Alphaproteobacteria bacterium]
MILVFGSLNMDLVMTVPTLPRPGETVLTESYVTKPGGKGNNQAVAAARAGARVVMAGAVGADEFGRRLVDNLRENGVDPARVATADKPTGVAYICVDAKAENFIAVASGANLAASADLAPDDALRPGATVLLQMEVPPAQNWAVVQRARDAGARTILNVAPAAPVPRDALEALDVLVVNELEAATVAAELELDTEGPATSARLLAREVGLTCVVTLGSQGAIAADGDRLWQVDPMRVEPVDTTGAGDAFTGVLAAALDAGLDLPQALRRASVGAALACLALGAQESLPTADAIDAALDRVPPPKLVTNGT